MAKNFTWQRIQLQTFLLNQLLSELVYAPPLLLLPPITVKQKQKYSLYRILPKGLLIVAVITRTHKIITFILCKLRFHLKVFFQLETYTVSALNLNKFILLTSFRKTIFFYIKLTYIGLVYIYFAFGHSRT